MDELTKQHTLRNLIVFSVAVIALGWVGRWLDNAAGSPAGEGIGTLIWIAAPLVVSFLLRALAGDGWRDLGIRPHLRGNAVWYAVSILFYPACIALVVAAGLIFGGISIAVSTPGALASLVKAVGAGLVADFAINVCEESGFRGYLAPKIYTLGWNDFVAHAAVGLVWGAWHLAFLSFVLSYTTEDALTLVPRFLVATVAASIVYGEIRILTDSVWPAVLMQTAGGALLGALLLGRFVQVDDRTAFLFSPGIEGTLMIALAAAAGVAIHLWRRSSIAPDA